MPIYEYRCDACGFQKEHLQKMNDRTQPVMTSGTQIRSPVRK